MKWMNVFTVLAVLIWSSNALAVDLCGERHKSSIDHKPRADVVHNPQPFFNPDPIDIPITVDLVERYGLNAPAGVDLDVPLGFISVYKDGRILHDGIDISGDIKDRCNNDGASDETEQPKETKDGDFTDT